MSTKTCLRIATRKSLLALWQAEYVANSLCQLYPGLRIEFIRMSTQGDKILDTPLAKVGVKGYLLRNWSKAYSMEKRILPFTL